MTTVTNEVFLFVVGRMRGLAKVPGFPQVFDAMLLSWTMLTRRDRLAAMESLEAEMMKRDGVSLAVHRYGGTEFVRGGRELGHMHGHGLVDVRLNKVRAEELIAEGRVGRHHQLPHSGWVSFQLESRVDVAFAVRLLEGRP